MKFIVACFALCIGFSVCLTHPVSAQTMSFGDAVDLWAQACGADVKKFCKGIKPGSGQLPSCLAAKASPSCKGATSAFQANMEARLAAQEAAPQLCAFDVQEHCASQKQGQARKLHCLMRPEIFRTLMKPCKEALEAAGWLDTISTKAQ